MAFIYNCKLLVVCESRFAKLRFELNELDPI